ncbi:hypothetical protein ALP99_102458 [Pseudomonas syringae pv. tomato]|uniref:Uncharacterized protein n=2 Tax=Pseudomonas syringae group genomosp. 3 TaxID=251701 RepID=A0AAQ0SKW8_PSEUB|nr:hypothetical protein XJ28_09720 [Pseudomonas syringae pv. tomato]KKI26629.1 hypothetical protein WX98_08730 [Pseudomonas syringae pv. persicae]KPW47038.1 hypothetical protein ALO88_102549 [Pseudomonas syringae pv. antirrhini]QBI64298.1 hypothetical protein EIZ61_24060 [Pseudomonas syringae]KGK94085.1 hypothetical protein NB04_17785 [Pseudomonas syringae pv. tomato]
MFDVKIEIHMAGRKKSIPVVARDSTSGKRIGSNAAFRLTVMAFLGWVGRKFISFLGDDSN